MTATRRQENFEKKACREHLNEIIRHLNSELSFGRDSEVNVKKNEF